MSQVLLYSLTAALNPTLLTATTLMLLLPNPKRLLLGYLLGAYMTSITVGLVIVFALQDSGAVDTAENTLSPAADIVLGLILLMVAFVLHSGRHERHKEKKAEKEKKTPRWQRSLSKGRSRDTFVVGALLSFPGASYLAALSEISQQDLSATATVLSVIGSNIVMLAILEIPLLGYALAPDWTRKAIRDFRELLTRHGERILFIGALVMGFALVGRGLGELLF